MTGLYPILLAIHNIVRWVALLTGLWSLARSLPGMQGGRPFTSADRAPIAAFMGSMHLQLVLGLMLFAIMGMGKIPVFASAPRPSFQWEHLALGVLAVVFATLASTLSKRGDDARTKFRMAAIMTGLSLVCILAAIPWFRSLFPQF